MKAFFLWTATSASALLLSAVAGASSGDAPTVAGPYTELRKTPVFTSPVLPLAKTWGPTLPVGTGFQVEKVYGRWIYGRPLPLKNMRSHDFAPQGWLFSRMLLLPGDSDSLSASVRKQSHSILFHARAVWRKLGLGQAPLWSPLDVLEGLTLSTKTLAAFSKAETASSEARGEFHFFPEAKAEDPATSMGLTGTELSFLDQEIKVIQEKKKREAILRESKKLKPPPVPSLDENVRRAVLGRYMLARYLDLPPLSMEEIDGFIYMRATAMRALHGCPKSVQSRWENRRWNFLRIYRMKSRPELPHPWLEIALPGGYFGVSARAIELAGNEAELAFLLVRQLVRDLRIKRKDPRIESKNWPEILSMKAEELWDQVLKSQSTKEAEGFDVADDIAVDMQAIECLAGAGYQPLAAIGYLRKLALNKDRPWASWFTEHSIGLDYRIERVSALTQEAIAQRKIPEGKDTQARRFASAAKQWNILP